MCFQGVSKSTLGGYGESLQGASPAWAPLYTRSAPQRPPAAAIRAAGALQRNEVGLAAARGARRQACGQS